MQLENKKVVVTGGANGIGEELVTKLLEQKALVGVFDADGAALDALRAENPDVSCFHCDIADFAQVEKGVGEFCAAMGGIDILVNNAGCIDNSLLVRMGEGKLTGFDRALWDRVIAINLNAVFYMTVNVVQRMVENRTKGLIINVSSVCAEGNAGQSAYSAAKAGVNALTVTWAKELGMFGIRVAGIAPGFTRTEAALRSMEEHVILDWEKKTPLRRMAMPSEIADGMLFIIQNNFFNGRVLELDGGLRI